MIAVGIDVSKSKSMISIINSYGEIITTRGIDVHTELAVTQCLDLLKQSKASTNNILSHMQAIAYTLPEYPVVRAMK